MPYPVSAVRGKNFGSPPFTPLNISGLIAWFDFSDITTLFQNSTRTTPVTTDAQPIGGVADKSGAGNHATQTTDAKRPTYKANITNGKSISRYNNTPFLDFPWAYTLTAETVFVVMSFTPTGGGQFDRIFTQSDASDDYATPGQYIPMLRNATNTAIASFTNGAARASIPVTASTPIIFVSHHSGTTLTNRYNGANGTPYSFALNKAFTRGRLGGSLEAAPASFFTGDICEVIAYNVALDSTQIANVETYLAAKWGISF